VADGAWRMACEGGGQIRVEAVCRTTEGYRGGRTKGVRMHEQLLELTVLLPSS